MKLKFLPLLVIFALMLVALCACGGNGGDTNTDTNTNTNSDTESTKTTYTVKVVDYKGNPVSSGIFVGIYKGEEELGFKKANAAGEASFTLENGEYTFDLTIADDSYTYNLNDCTLTKDAPTKEVMLYSTLGNEVFTIYPVDKDTGDRYEYKAKFVNEGATLVSMEGMTYYVFQPTRGGVYKFSYIADRAINIGYYGGSEHYVFAESNIEIKDRAFEIEIKNEGVSNAGTGTTRIIIGISSLSIDSCYLTVERVSDPQKEIQRVDYVPTQVPNEISKYNYLNGKLVDLDITDENLTVVYNSEDGFYHYGTEDGPIVLIRIASASKYIAPFYEMCQTSALYGQILDDNGSLVRYEIYNAMIEAYAEKCDDAGVVPLNNELLRAIELIGKHYGWYEGSTCIFKVGGSIDEETGDITEGTVVEFPAENAPYFACCYLEKTDTGVGESKILVTDTTDAKELLVMLAEGEALSFKSTRQVTSVLTIENAQDIKIIVGEEEYSADENGTIEVELQGGASIEFSMVSLADKPLDVSFTFVTKI